MSMNELNKDTISTALLQYLQNLEERMKNVSKESNQFANRYLFGGMISIIALLNTDLLIEKTIITKDANIFILTVLIIIIVFLSWNYFNGIAKRILRFENAYRRTKHKYEILLYGILLNCDEKIILSHLEIEPKPKGEEVKFPEEIEFTKVAEYLHDHHGRSLKSLSPRTYERNLAMLILSITLVIKIIIYSIIR